MPPEKSEGAFRTIREVADWLAVPTHVLRFWESKFDMIAPVKGAGGRRYYRPEDMRLLGGIKVMLHDQGLTIRGVGQRIEADGVEPVMALSPELDMAEPPAARARRVIRSDDAEPEARVVPFQSRAGPSPAAASAEQSGSVLSTEDEAAFAGADEEAPAGPVARDAVDTARASAPAPPATARPQIRRDGPDRADPLSQPDAPDADDATDSEPLPGQPVDTPSPPQPDDGPAREPRSPPQPVDDGTALPSRAPPSDLRRPDADLDDDAAVEETGQLGDPGEPEEHAADGPAAPPPFAAPGQRRRLRRIVRRLRAMIDDVERELADGSAR